MNELKVFNNEEFGEIRTLQEDGNTIFCGADIARALGYARPNDAISAHARGTVKHRIGVQTGTRSDGTPAIQHIEMLFIPEGDVYRLITHSKLPAAEKFEKWVFDEVLPSIRKTGTYSIKKPTVDQTVPLMRVHLQAAALITKLWNAAGVKPEYQAMALGDKFPELIPKLPAIALQQTKVTYDKGTIAKMLGVMSKTGKPHAQAIGAIINHLDISESETEQVPYCNNGHDGFDTQYTESVAKKVGNWLMTNDYPKGIIYQGKQYQVEYTTNFRRK